MSQKTFDVAYLSENLADILFDLNNHIEITLTCNGVPCARVLPIIQTQNLVPQAGLNRGSMVTNDDFDAPSIEPIWDLCDSPRGALRERR